MACHVLKVHFALGNYLGILAEIPSKFLRFLFQQLWTDIALFDWAHNGSYDDMNKLCSQSKEDNCIQVLLNEKTKRPTCTYLTIS